MFQGRRQQAFPRGEFHFTRKATRTLWGSPYLVGLRPREFGRWNSCRVRRCLTAKAHGKRAAGRLEDDAGPLVVIALDEHGGTSTQLLLTGTFTFFKSSGISSSSLPRASTAASLPSGSTKKTLGIELMPHDLENSLCQPRPW